MNRQNCPMCGANYVDGRKGRERFACGSEYGAKDSDNLIFQTQECKFKMNTPEPTPSPEAVEAAMNIADNGGTEADYDIVIEHLHETTEETVEEAVGRILAAEVRRLRAQIEQRTTEYAKALNRRVDVENVLYQVAAGKREPLTPDECRELANKLGVSPA